jgi:hypothetical protein
MPTDIMFSTNPTDWTAVEGLYVAQQRQEGSITGVNVNTVGLFDVTLRGPTTPQVVASMGEFLDLYGGRDAGGGGAIVNKIWKGLLNRKFSWPMVFCRVADPDAVKATANAANAVPTDIIKIEATSSGTWANGATGHGITYAITDASDAVATHFNLVIKYAGQVITYKNLNTNGSGDDNTTSVVGSALTNLVTVTKLANGRPVNTVSDVSLASGTDGTVAVADYESAFDAIVANPLPRIVPVGCDVMISASDHATINGYVSGKASLFPLTTFTMWAGGNNGRADEITAKGSQVTTPAENIAWCYNASSTLDSSGTAIETGPHLDAAVIMSSTDVAIHLGDEANIPLLSHIKSVYNNSLTRADFALLRAAGITALEPVTNGFQFKSAVSSNSVGAIGDDTSVELADVRRRAWLVESFSRSIRHDVKKPATETRRATIINKLTAFCRDDQAAEHVVAPDDATLGPAFRFAFVETPQERARNMGKLLCKVRILPYLLTIVMLVDIGTGVINVKAE